MSKITICGIEIDLDKHLITYQKTPILFTKTEFQMVHALALKYKNGYVGVNTFKKIPPTKFLNKQPTDNSYRVMMCRIKKKIQQATQRKDIILTYSGLGYSFNQEL